MLKGISSNQMVKYEQLVYRECQIDQQINDFLCWKEIRFIDISKLTFRRWLDY